MELTSKKLEFSALAVLTGGVEWAEDRSTAQDRSSKEL